jgi:hypothetical protein
MQPLKFRAGVLDRPWEMMTSIALCFANEDHVN